MEDLFQRIIENPNDGNLYIQLGDNYKAKNVNQAYLCYEQASSLCTGESYELCIQKMNECKSESSFYVHPVSFVILSYNSKDIMIECLEAIRNTCVKGSYEVIVVDSNSTDGIREWLKEQNDIKLILNDKFDGFAAGCNQGAKYAKIENDIFLLNNDAIVTPRALFYMRLSLYSKQKIGAVGPVSSNVGEEHLYDQVQRLHDEWMELAETINQPSTNPIQMSHWLQGHALLIKRRIWDEVGMLDTDFKFGGYEDTEYGIRLNLAGYQLSVCKNAFVYHYGHTSMKTRSKEFDEALNINQKIFEDKFHISLDQVLESKYYRAASFVNEDLQANLNILQIYGGCANLLNIIKYNYPNCKLHSIQNNLVYTKVSSNYSDAHFLNINDETLPFRNESFDYIFFFEIENVEDLKSVLNQLKSLLKPTGHLVLCGKNANHISVVDSLIHGNLNIPLLKNCKYFYTTDDIRDLVNSCGFFIPRMSWIYQSIFTNLSESQKHTLDKILSLSDAKDRNTYIHTSVLIDAVKG